MPVEFSKASLTLYGANRISKSITTDNLKFTSIAMGDGLIPLENLQERTQLVSEQQRVSVAQVIQIASLVRVTGGSMTYTNNPDGFYLREMGLYVEDLELGSEQLYAVATVIPDGVNDYYTFLAPNASNMGFIFSPEMSTVVGFMDNVVIDNTAGAGTLENKGDDSEGAGLFVGLDDVTQHLMLRRIRAGEGIRVELDNHNQISVKIDPTYDPAPQVGDCYLQYPWDRSPTDKWPNLTFEDISASYQGYFFSAAGSGNENGPAHGVAQGQSVPNVDISHDHSYTRHNRMSTHGSGNYGGMWENESWQAVGWFSQTLKDRNGAYGALGNTVRPKSYGFTIWRRTDDIIGEQTFYKVDEDDVFETTVTLKKDKAGFIGLNPYTMLENRPPVLDRATIELADANVQQVQRYNRTTKEWESIADTRGLKAYNKDTVQERNLFYLDQPKENETLLIPNFGERKEFSNQWDKLNKKWIRCLRDANIMATS